MNQKGAGSKWSMSSGGRGKKKLSTQQIVQQRLEPHTATTYNSRELLLHKPPLNWIWFSRTYCCLHSLNTVMAHDYHINLSVCKEDIEGKTDEPSHGKV